jgi:hypothetical protein
MSLPRRILRSNQPPEEHIGQKKPLYDDEWHPIGDERKTSKRQKRSPTQPLPTYQIDDVTIEIQPTPDSTIWQVADEKLFPGNIFRSLFAKTLFVATIPDMVDQDIPDAKGLFSPESIPGDTELFVYGRKGLAHVYPDEQKRYEAIDNANSFDITDKNGNHCVASGDTQVIAKYGNHSDNPNCEVVAVEIDGKIEAVVKTLRDILPGEQITYSYGEEYFYLPNKEQKLSPKIIVRSDISYKTRGVLLQENHAHYTHILQDSLKTAISSMYHVVGRALKPSDKIFIPTAWNDMNNFDAKQPAHALRLKVVIGSEQTTQCVQIPNLQEDLDLLSIACFMGDIVKVRNILRHSPSYVINHQSTSGMTPLRWALHVENPQQREDLITLLMSHGNMHGNHYRLTSKVKDSPDKFASVFHDMITHNKVADAKLILSLMGKNLKKSDRKKLHDYFLFPTIIKSLIYALPDDQTNNETINITFSHLREILGKPFSNRLEDELVAARNDAAEKARYVAKLAAIDEKIYRPNSRLVDQPVVVLETTTRRERKAPTKYNNFFNRNSGDSDHTRPTRPSRENKR